MATYEYICPKDGTEHQVTMSLAEYSKENGAFVCPTCGADMRRKFSPPSISIK